MIVNKETFKEVCFISFGVPKKNVPEKIVSFEIFWSNCLTNGVRSTITRSATRSACYKLLSVIFVYAEEAIVVWFTADSQVHCAYGNQNWCQLPVAWIFFEYTSFMVSSYFVFIFTNTTKLKCVNFLELTVVFFYLLWFNFQHISFYNKTLFNIRIIPEIES